LIPVVVSIDLISVLAVVRSNYSYFNAKIA
jgi:hypothetical protein